MIRTYRWIPDKMLGFGAGMLLVFVYCAEKINNKFKDLHT